MAVREIAVFGLGRMGKAVAETFSEKCGQVIAIDSDQRKIDEIADKVTYAIRADITDFEAIKQLGIGNVDAAVVAMSESLDASITAIIASKEMGIPYVVVKAKDRVQGRIFEKIGADRVVYPEEEMGVRMAMSLNYKNLVDIITISEGISIVETKIPKEWGGKSLMELDLRRKYGFNVIAIKEKDEISINIQADEPLREDMIIVILGNDAKIKKVLGK